MSRTVLKAIADGLGKVDGCPSNRQRCRLCPSQKNLCWRRHGETEAEGEYFAATLVFEEVASFNVAGRDLPGVFPPGKEGRFARAIEQLRLIDGGRIEGTLAE